MTRILVIDDEPLVLALMVELLERAGHEVVASESATSALGLLDDSRVALVVSDVLMPGLSGFELLRAAQLRRPGLPVLLVTGAGAEDGRAEALASGAAGFLEKPFSAAILYEQVREALEGATGGLGVESGLSGDDRRALRSSAAARGLA